MKEKDLEGNHILHFLTIFFRKLTHFKNIKLREKNRKQEKA